ncbi:MAG: isoprenylcysteine carboxylmethyltransferase family protein [Acidobacteriaceae bacterium]|nr:isoprenylcysteine carboxylmethyltransferase family protein [Acidobacteriaceae bacterium]
MVLIVMLIALPLVHMGIPWLLSHWGPHHGWIAGAPGLINKLGLIVVGCAIALIIWITTTALRHIQLLPERIPIGLRPTKLMQTGPYARTRHPMYMAEMLLWLGLAIYFGSLVVLGTGLIIVILAARFVIPREERALESQFGEEYRQYRKRVPALVSWKRRPSEADRLL